MSRSGLRPRGLSTIEKLVRDDNVLDDILSQGGKGAARFSLLSKDIATWRWIGQTI